MTPISEKENLKREIGVRSLTLAILNITVGTGIFVIPAILAESMGAIAIVTYLICGVLVLLIALCFAELGSRTNISGGPYEYIESAFGPYAGFLANNVYWCGASVISDAALANALADTLKYFFPSLNNETFRVLFFTLIFGTIGLLNIRSVKNGVRFIEVTAIGKLIPLIVIVIAGFGFVRTENLRWTSFPSVGTIGASSLLLFYAFMGFEAPLSNGGEIKNAKRTVPLGTILGMSSVLILYIAIQTITQGVLGDTISAHKDSPLAAVAGIIFGKAGIVLMLIATAISMLGTLGGDILSVPRVIFAGGRDGVFPKILGKVHPRFLTPYTSIIMYTLLGFIFAILGGFKQLAVLSSASILLIYLGVVLATIKLKKTRVVNSEKTFHVPGGLIIPLLAVIVIVWLLSNLTGKELFSMVIFLIIITAIYLIMHVWKKRKPISG
jgi:basic amino acid/polyamine antiporter, APA family